MIFDCSVVQGRSIGPIMFIMCINDMIKLSKLIKFTIYADDTNLTYATKKTLRKLFLFEIMNC